MNADITIDRGNSGIKVAVWTPDGGMRVLTELRKQPLAEILASIGYYDIGTAVYCSVVPSRRGSDLEILAHRAGRVIEFSPGMKDLPLKSDYAPTLGADRMAAALGALAIYGKGSDILIADIGTAATYDHVDPSGHFTGGNIAPGIKLRLESLARHTSLPKVDPDSCTSAGLLGTDTTSAMYLGAVGGIAAEIEYYRSRIGAQTRVILTGGSSLTMARSGLIAGEYTVEPDLIHIGLHHLAVNAL